VAVGVFVGVEVNVGLGVNVGVGVNVDVGIGVSVANRLETLVILHEILASARTTIRMIITLDVVFVMGFIFLHALLIYKYNFLPIIVCIEHNQEKIISFVVLQQLIL